MKKAIILGASGLIGSQILSLLLNDKRYSTVTCITRKPLDIEHDKLIVKTGDLFNLDAFSSQFENGDDLFIAIGTTKAKTPDKLLYEKIDLGIPVAALKLAVKMGVNNAVTVSSMGANPTSKIWYAALKGRMEKEVLSHAVSNNIIVRPSMLLGDRKESRTGEKIGKILMKGLDFAIPKKHKAIDASTVARAMIVLANQKHKKSIYINEELFDLAQQY